MPLIKTQQDLDAAAERGMATLYPPRTKIMVGMATCGLATGSQAVFDTINEEAKRRSLDAIIVKTGCIGYCQREPIVEVSVPGRPRITYAEITPEKAKELIAAIAENRLKPEWALCKTEEEESVLNTGTKKYTISDTSQDINRIPNFHEVPFFRKQLKIVLRNCGLIDPYSIDEYIARGGYRSLYKVVSTMKPEEVIEEVITSGLRGRGGAGFPTGRKWSLCRKSEGDYKYVICNADEGDPGAYMDRSVLEGDPHSVIEGMAIGAYAVGAKEGYIYVRTEYPLAVQTVKHAIAQAEEYGLLGSNVFGSGFDFRIKIAQGSGAFVCGEETSLIASIQGDSPEPKLRPPFPTQKGLWGRPTNINNVETWANVPVILAKGGKWFATIGSEKSKGTKVFSLVGQITNTGLVEVPMGISLREIVFDIGGGIPGGRKFKAVQTGGPSGGCIPLELIDLPVDYERLAETGSIMGSGGMVVMDERTCVVDVAKFFLSFTADESCGRCNACREGTQAMLEVLTRLSDGAGVEGDIEFLQDLGNAVKDASLCGLGATAPNPVLSTLRYFRDEFEAHIRQKRCPALVCRNLIRYYINPDKCKACMLCLKACPVEAIRGEKKQVHVIDQTKCTKCGSCLEVCPEKFAAVEKLSGCL